MSDSLRDQLLKLGLVDEQKVKKAKQEKHQRQKAQRHGKPTPVDPARERAAQAAAAKAERDRQLNAQRREEAERKARKAEIKQLIEANRLPRDDGEIAFNFVDGQKIRRIYVTETVHQRLASGAAVVVKLNGRYDVVPGDIGERIRQRDAAFVVANPSAQSHEPPPQDDPYADFKVPDDLMW